MKIELFLGLITAFLGIIFIIQDITLFRAINRKLKNNLLCKELLTMWKIIFSEMGKKESERLNFNVERYIKAIIDYIPKSDLIGLDFIYITDKPNQWKKHLDGAAGAYFQKHKSSPAYIEIYLSKMYGHISSAESMNRMIPIQNVGLAQTLFHEVGHHIERIRSHGIKKNNGEFFADHYSKNLLSKYLIGNADSINSCFNNLEKIAIEKGLSLEIIDSMKNGWEEEFRSITKMAGAHDNIIPEQTSWGRTKTTD